MQTHRAHDFSFLIRRWRALARATRIPLKALEEDSEMPVFYLRSPRLALQGGIYISAGIHGDEAASTEALITWAEQNAHQLRSLPLLLLPCLNPWGLINNCRLNAQGLDLNRSFHLETPPFIGALKKLIAPYRFQVALMLHEDFDAQGIYLYEIAREKPFWGESLLEAARAIIPIEGRAKVDGRKAVAGLIRRRFAPKTFAEIGFPEAIWLHQHHARRTFTLETPSEFALSQRVAAQVACIQECVQRALPA